nr:immunoglobulin light chain junction region [Macaca mulatta]MOX69214.1 immunoglobulin light chain junction region [Macaca mulatta]MOX69291.1 immunoglobulin light chain junction region [Macaca mulatta]MOX69366.1 immunoglobulin light chain junction region [Macaca mulatta]MOX69429.1 immunoglobulin light chain junction region [Macaca mulatta]
DYYCSVWDSSLSNVLF